MADVIDRVVRAGGYPWDEWKDGQSRCAIRGVDFDCTPEAFRTSCYMAAARNKPKPKKAQVAISGNEVRFRFYDPPKKKTRSKKRGGRR